MTIGASEARQMLSYNAETGVVHWLVDRNPQVRKGGRFGRLSKKNGYRDGQIHAKRYMEHRLIWLLVHGEWPEHEIDHINGKRDDNRLCNLRPATRVQNCANRKSFSASGLLGVCFHRATGKWQAQIKRGGRCEYLGLFTSAQEAGQARTKRAAELDGVFAKPRADEALAWGIA